MTEEPIYDARTFWELLQRRVEISGDRTMLIDETDRTVTFVELTDRAEQVAAGLHALGVGESTPVTWILPTRIETIVVSFALCRLGAVQNPIIHIYRHREVRFCIAETGARLVIHPGTWGGFDYGAMIDEVTADLDPRPETLVGYDTLPTGDPATLPPPRPDPAATPRFGGCTTRRAPPPIPKESNTPTKH